MVLFFYTAIFFCFENLVLYKPVNPNTLTMLQLKKYLPKNITLPSQITPSMMHAIGVQLNEEHTPYRLEIHLSIVIACLPQSSFKGLVQ